MSRHGVCDRQAHRSTKRPPSGLTTDVKTMMRIERNPSGSNPRSCVATGSSGGGAARASSGSAGTCSGKFGASLIMAVLRPVVTYVMQRIAGLDSREQSHVGASLRRLRDAFQKL